MRKKENRPSWWQLYLLGLGMIGLLVLGAWAPLSERGHQAAAIGAVVVACGLVEVWLRANRGALLHIDGLTFVEIPSPAAARDAQDAEYQAAAGSRQPPAERETRIPAMRPPAEAGRKEMVL